MEQLALHTHFKNCMNLDHFYWCNEWMKKKRVKRDGKKERGRRWRGWLKICNIENGNWIKRNTSWIFFSLLFRVFHECVLWVLARAHRCKWVFIAFKTIPWKEKSQNGPQRQPCFICNECINELEKKQYVHRCSTSLIDIVTQTYRFCWSLLVEITRTHAHAHATHKPFNRLALKVTLTVHMIFEMVRVVSMIFFFFGFASKMMKVTILRSVCVCVWLFIYLLSFSFIRVQVSVVNVCIESIFFLYLALSWAYTVALFAGPFVRLFVQCTHSTDSKLKYWQI